MLSLTAPMCLYSLVKHRCCENCQEVYSIAHRGLNTEGQMHCSSQPNTSPAFPKRLEMLQAELGNYSLLETSLSLQVEGGESAAMWECCSS